MTRSRFSVQMSAYAATFNQKSACAMPARPCMCAATETMPVAMTMPK